MKLKPAQIENCPRCKEAPALNPHNCPCTWTGLNGTMCIACQGKGGRYVELTPGAAATKIICEPCNGQGYVDTPKEKNCKCCWRCIAKCDAGMGPKPGEVKTV
jgi:DnaJ-class molecular chaperone